MAWCGVALRCVAWRGVSDKPAGSLHGHGPRRLDGELLAAEAASAQSDHCGGAASCCRESCHFAKFPPFSSHKISLQPQQRSAVQVVVDRGEHTRTAFSLERCLPISEQVERSRTWSRSLTRKEGATWRPMGATWDEVDRVANGPANWKLGFG